MDRITIFERDISNIPAEDIGTNIVYVPGYAVMGPVNTPTLCRNLNEFQSIFGITPYYFENEQKYERIGNWKTQEGNKLTGIFYPKDSQETAYVYACELLNKGLPVLFERVFDESKEDDFTLFYDLYDNDSKKLTIKAKFPGLYANSIKFKLKKNKSVETDYHYTLIIEQGKNYTNSTLKSIQYLDLAQNKEIVFSVSQADSDYFGNLAENNIIKFESVGQINNIVLTEIETSTPLSYPHTEDVLPEWEDEQNQTQYGNTMPDWYEDDANPKEFELFDLYKKMNAVDEENKTLWNESKKVYPQNLLFTKLTDRGEYELKFITSGGYPVFDCCGRGDFTIKNNITKIMLWTAAKRGDAIAIIDYVNSIGKATQVYSQLEGLDPEENGNTLQYSVNQLVENDEELGESGSLTVTLSNNREESTLKYGTIFTPWATYKSIVYSTPYVLAGSFGYLESLAISVKTNPNWYPVAGVTRGVIPELKQLNTNVTNAIAESLQTIKGISINPITLINRRYTIWGNRTLNNNGDVLIASSSLNIRNLVCDVKKAVYVAAKKFMFEPISEILWLNFKSEIEPLLDKMKSGNGLTKYEILRKSTTEKATICAVIRLWAVDAVEKFDVTIELSDSYVNIE